MNSYTFDRFPMTKQSRDDEDETETKLRHLTEISHLQYTVAPPDGYGIVAIPNTKSISFYYVVCLQNERKFELHKVCIPRWQCRECARHH